MASEAYYEWLAAGKPFKLATPLVALRNLLRRYGYTVYDIGNERHQKAEPPEDHMPYSATGWPVASPRWWGFALDVMPPPAGSGLPSLAQLGRQIHNDRRNGVAGLAFLKYMNWEPGDGNCWHDSWQPAYARRSSSDRGHIHLSGRSDQYLTNTLGDYDPVARFRAGGDMGTTEEIKAANVLLSYTDPRVEVLQTGDDSLLRGPNAGKPMWLVGTVKRIAADLLTVKNAVTAPPAPVEVVLSDEQLERIADLVVGKLAVTGSFQFTATPTAQ